MRFALFYDYDSFQICFINYSSVYMNGWQYCPIESSHEDGPKKIIYIHVRDLAEASPPWRAMEGPLNHPRKSFFGLIKKMTLGGIEGANSFLMLAKCWNFERPQEPEIHFCLDCEPLFARYSVYCPLCNAIKCEDCAYCNGCKVKIFQTYCKGFLWRSYHGAWFEEAKWAIALILFSIKHGQSPLCRLFGELPREIFMLIFEETYGKVRGLLEEERGMFSEE